MKVQFTEDAWAQLRDWMTEDPSVTKRIVTLVEDIRRTPFKGLGKPEPLKGPLSGWWSRRITDHHRLVYRVRGRPGEDQSVEIAECRYHYAR